MILFLIGYRGSGKTTIGRAMAARLGCDWVDSDAEIECAAGRTIPEIFASGGESEFRERERQTIAGLIERARAGHGDIVVSLGGGAVLIPEVCSIMRASGRCVWLQSDAETLIGRLRHAPRPALTDLTLDEEVRRMLEQRNPVYAGCADYEIDTGLLTPEQTVEQIAHWLAGVDNK